MLSLSIEVFLEVLGANMGELRRPWGPGIDLGLYVNDVPNVSLVVLVLPATFNEW